LEGWEWVVGSGELAVFCQPKRILAANGKCLFHAIKRLCVLRFNASFCMQANLLTLTYIRGTAHQRVEWEDTGWPNLRDGVRSLLPERRQHRQIRQYHAASKRDYPAGSL
jgi:hypothetical protein